MSRSQQSAAATEGKQIVFAIPSKGSLYEDTLEFLKLAGVAVVYGSQRQYTARLGGVDGISVLFQRAEEIPVKVAGGSVDIGLTGEDLFREQAINSDRLLLVMRDLGYGHARLVVAVPNTWIDVSSMEDLGDLALSFRLKHHRTLRIATKFPNLAREFLSRYGVIDYALVESLGATESAPASGVADLIIDLTSSGKTLSDNHLKTVKDGTVISSQACLIASRRVAAWDEARLGRLETFLDMIESYLRGKETYNLQAAVRRTNLGELSRATHHWHVTYSLPMDTPDGAGSKDEYAVIRMTCPRNDLHQLIRRLRDGGAEEIIVTQPEYVFRHQSESFQRLKHILKKTEGGDQDDD
jgi:ATP phosphoribosyltransferase